MGATVVSVKLDDATVARLDELAREQRKATGACITRSDILKEAVKQLLQG